MSYLKQIRQSLTEDQRLVVLRSLIDCNNSANESVLQSCLDAYGHRISRDLVRTHLCWLAEQQLVRISDIAGCYVAHITGRGEDVAKGLTSVSGVKKPRASDYE